MKTAKPHKSFENVQMSKLSIPKTQKQNSCRLISTNWQQYPTSRLNLRQLKNLFTFKRTRLGLSFFVTPYRFPCPYVKGAHFAGCLSKSSPSFHLFSRSFISFHFFSISFISCHFFSFSSFPSISSQFPSFPFIFPFPFIFLPFLSFLFMFLHFQSFLFISLHFMSLRRNFVPFFFSSFSFFFSSSSLSFFFSINFALGEGVNFFQTAHFSYCNESPSRSLFSLVGRARAQ